MADSVRTAVYVSLVFLGIIISTLYMVMLSYNPSAFIILFALYILGYCSYLFVIMLIGRRKWENDLRFEVANYITLFNIFFAGAILMFAAYFKRQTPSSPTYPSYTRIY